MRACGCGADGNKGGFRFPLKGCVGCWCAVSRDLVIGRCGLYSCISACRHCMAFFLFEEEIFCLFCCFCVVFLPKGVAS
jgi:hypothetical protein